MNPSDVPAWLQAGGLVAFAAAVWLEQRSIRTTLDAMRVMLSGLLERDRLRDVRDDARDARDARDPRRPPSHPTIGE